MFGHQNDVITQDQKQDANVTLPDDAMQALTSNPVTTPPTDNPEPVQSPPAITLDESAPSDVVPPPAPPVDPDFTAPANFGFTGSPKQPVRKSSSEDFNSTENDSTDSNLAENEVAKEEPFQPIADEVKEEASPVKAPSTPDASDDELLSIKADALHDLSPLVDQLDLGPEEKFKTVMMLIQTSDDKALIPDAYELAKKIGDKKVKAQALLDVVNEINYFTHQDEAK